MAITEIDGYQVLRKLGSGGMGQVFLVQHPRLPRRDALKLLDSGVSRTDEFRARFQREADLLALLSHPNIVTLYDRGVHDDQLWISMEYIEGTDAGELVASRGPLPLSLALTLISGAGAALDYAWRKQRVTHRDVKPANLLVSFEDYANDTDELVVEAVKLADFGIAKAVEESPSLTSTGITVGTMTYISPEAIEGHPIDHRSDIYSLGCTAYHLITGEAPFSEPSITALMSAHLIRNARPASAVVEGLPTSIDPVFEKALAKNPADRYQSCAAFILDLSTAINDGGGATNAAFAQTMRAPTTSLGSKPREAVQSVRRRRIAFAATAAMFSVIVIASGITLMANLSDSSTTEAAISPTLTSSATSPASSPSSTTVSRTEARPDSETRRVEAPVTETVVATPQPYEGQPCGPDQFNEISADGTLYCSAMNGAWSDRTHQSRPAVEAGTSCSEPGARARVARTDGIATCKVGPNGALGWFW